MNHIIVSGGLHCPCEETLAWCMVSCDDDVVDRLPEILNVGIQHSEGLLSSSLVNRVTGLRCKKHFIPKRRNCDEKCSLVYSVLLNLGIAIALPWCGILKGQSQLSYVPKRWD